jgi:hypothetical protein
LQQPSGIFSAPFDGYNLQFPFFSADNAPLWHAAIGYEISGIVGILLIGGVVYGLGYLFRRRDQGSDASPVAGQLGWLEHSISGIAGAIERAVFTEEHARKQGWLQRVDPRAKLGMFLALILAASLSTSLIVLGALYLVILGAICITGGR